MSSYMWLFNNRCYMLFVEYVNGCNLYLYNNSTALAIVVLDGEVTFFSDYQSAYMWALPF